MPKKKKKKRRSEFLPIFQGKMWCLIEKKTGKLTPIGVLSSFYTSSAHVIGFEKKQDLLDAADPIWNTHEVRKVEFRY